MTPAEVERLLVERTLVPYPFAGGPLVRFSLLERQTDHHTLLLNWHEIVHDHDPRSAGLLTSDVVEQYLALAENRAPRLETFALRYVDYAKWARDWYASTDGRAEIEAARQRLRGAKPIVVWDRPSDTPVGPEGIVESFILEGADAERFDRACRSRSVTRFWAMLAVVGVLLRRWTGQEDDTAFLGLRNFRNQRPELAPVAGRFVGPIAMRVSVEGRPTWGELFSRARRHALEAVNESVPMPLSFALGTDSPTQHPFYRVLINDMGGGSRGDAPAEAPRGLSFESSKVRTPIFARTTLFIALGTLEAGQMMVIISGAADRFERRTVTRFATELGQLLASIHPDERPFA